ncbi:hypothetical protein ES703_113779 [subsurface metagenome]
MTAAVKNATKRFVIRRIPAYISSDDIEICSREAAQINVRHQLEVLVPIIRIRTNCIHLLGCINQIGVTGPSSTSAVLSLSR